VLRFGLKDLLWALALIGTLLAWSIQVRQLRREQAVLANKHGKLLWEWDLFVNALRKEFKTGSGDKRWDNVNDSFNLNLQNYGEDNLSESDLFKQFERYVYSTHALAGPKTAAEISDLVQRLEQNDKRDIAMRKTVQEVLEEF
jgi:hypothetical protein